MDKDGVHQAKVNTDENGNIKNNSYGTLMEYYPANISHMHVENTKGTFDVLAETPEGEATIYTIKGYEDFDLQGGNPAMIASAAAKLSGGMVAVSASRSGIRVSDPTDRVISGLRNRLGTTLPRVKRGTPDIF